MVINESLVARTFGTYVLQIFDVSDKSLWVPLLGVFLIIFAFGVNFLKNEYIQKFSLVTAVAKVLGIAALAIAGLWASGLELSTFTAVSTSPSSMDFLGAVALGILAYKGFTTITNSGDEIENPSKNLGRSIAISLIICTFIYLIVCLAVGSSLSISEIVSAKNYALAEASKPIFGKYGMWLTVGFAIIATVSGIVASIFAVSRMLAMLTDMKLVPHSHFGMPGGVQKHTLVYTVVLAIILTVLFDLSRIAAIGAILYIFMDMTLHLGLIKSPKIRKKLNANLWILILALLFDLVVFIGLVWVKAKSDMVVIYASIIGFLLIFLGEYFFLRKIRSSEESS